ncbi:MAG: DUF551 domain-containing protein [Pseudomonadota bacterium]
MKKLIERLKVYRAGVDKLYGELSSIAQLSKADVDAAGSPLKLLLTDAITALEAMQWIPVSERLPPEHHGTVAVLISDGSILTAWATYWHGSRRDFAEWTFPIDYEDDMLVTHWTPLPATADLLTGEE